MTKAEFIERYGVDAYEELKRKCREYYQANKEQKKEYRQTHKEQITKYQKEYQKEYYQANKEQKKEYRQSNKERIADYNKKYRTANNDKIREYGKSLRGRAKKLANIYNSKDKNRGFDPSNNVSSKWIVENIFSGQKCIYCGEDKWERLGCDRIDNSKPHTADNIVCACGLCNIERQDKYSVEEFKQYRALHPRACDIPKAPAFILSSTGALKKKEMQ